MPPLDLQAAEPFATPRPPFLGPGSRTPSYTSSPQRELPGFDFIPTTRSRASTNDSLNRPIINRVPIAQPDLPTRRPPVSTTHFNVPRSRATSNADVFSDPEDGNDMPDLAHDGDMSSSPVTSSGAGMSSRSASSSALDTNNPAGMLAKVRPPQPQSSRATKPPPPPPPMKRSALSSSQIPRV